MRKLLDRRYIQEGAILAGDGRDDLGDRIVSFAKANLGSSVGNGQCYALADEALRSAGARSAPYFAKPGEYTEKRWNHADYKWGTPVDLKSVQPGDILQFRNFKSTIRKQTETETRRTWENHIYTAPHHTAIVEQNLGNGEVIVLEQSKDTAWTVVRSTIAVSGKNCGPLKTGMPEITALCRISGTVKAYRATSSPVGTKARVIP